jgi:hypothetical protein
MTYQSSDDKPTVYRGVGSFVGGVLVMVLCVAGAVDLVVETGSSDLFGASVMLLVAALAFVFGAYPAAFSGEDTLVVRNPFRVITVPWAVVTDLTARLSFIVHVGEARYTVWAVPVSLRDRRKAERDRLKETSRVQREARRVGSGIGLGGGSSSRRPYEHLDRLSCADQAVIEMTGRRELHADRLKNAQMVSLGTEAKTGTESRAETESRIDVETETERSIGDVVLVRWARLPFVVIGVGVVLVIIGCLV